METNKIKLAVRADELARIQDLGSELREITEGKVDWVYRYCDKKKIAAAIFEDFIEYNKRHSAYMKRADETLSDDDIRYIFSSDMYYEGILSDTQAFQSLASLISDFNLTGKEPKQRIFELLNKIFAMVNPNEKEYVFNTSPYLYKSLSFKDGVHSYIDTITWVLSSVLALFRLHISGKLEVEAATIDKAIEIYKVCIQYLIESYISTSSEKNKFNKGWNFTKGCDVPSLYFTFSVSEILIDILTTFENVIRSADVDVVSHEINTRLSSIVTQEEIDSKIAQLKATYESSVNALTDESEAGKRELELFKLANDGFSVYDDESPYKQLEDKVKEAANNIWNVVKDGISDTFYSADLETVIKESVIEQSVSSDALFNSIFIINTVINAGLDEDFDDLVNYYTPLDSAEYDDAISAYDAMRDYLRMAYDHVWQVYRNLKKNGKDYKVNEYTLSFDESFKDKRVSEIAEELRKAKMRVFSLMPLLVKAKTTIGEFVIAYPQYDMQIYLETILQHRYKRSNGEIIWVWEKDNYSTSSNFYFISALADFYRYYEKYEQNAIKNAFSNADRKNEIIQNARLEYDKELESKGGKIYDLKHAIELKNAEIEAFKAEIEALKAEAKEFTDDPLKYGMSIYIQQVMKDKIAKILSADIVGSILTGLSEQLTNELLARVDRKAAKLKASEFTDSWYENPDTGEIDPKIEKLQEGISDFGKALLSERIAEMRYVHKGWQLSVLDGKPKASVALGDGDIETQSDYVSSDINNLLRIYVKQIVNDTMSSDYVNNNGYPDLPSVISEYKSKMKK